nr:IS110 family transposase [Kibdelosporangium phytohabitans]
MVASRRGGCKPGKSDPIDARAALREPKLAVAHLDGPTFEVKLLTDYRHDLVVQRTELINRLHRHLHEIDLEPQTAASASTTSLTSWDHRVVDHTGVVARIAGMGTRQMPSRTAPMEHLGVC